MNYSKKKKEEFTSKEIQKLIKKSNYYEQVLSKKEVILTGKGEKISSEEITEEQDQKINRRVHIIQSKRTEKQVKLSIEKL